MQSNGPLPQVINEPSPSVIVGTIIAMATDIAASTIIIINVTLFARPTFATFDCLWFLVVSPLALPCNITLPLFNGFELAPAIDELADNLARSSIVLEPGKVRFSFSGLVAIS